MSLLVRAYKKAESLYKKAQARSDYAEANRIETHIMWPLYHAMKREERCMLSDGEMAYACDASDAPDD